jgi:hypothetical protein
MRYRPTRRSISVNLAAAQHAELLTEGNGANRADRHRISVAKYTFLAKFSFLLPLPGIEPKLLGRPARNRSLYRLSYTFIYIFYITIRFIDYTHDLYFLASYWLLLGLHVHPILCIG